GRGTGFTTLTQNQSSARTPQYLATAICARAMPIVAPVMTSVGQCAPKWTRQSATTATSAAAIHRIRGYSAVRNTASAAAAAVWLDGIDHRSADRAAAGSHA